jgi:hypothetical protein
VKICQEHWQQLRTAIDRAADDSLQQARELKLVALPS